MVFYTMWVLLDWRLMARKSFFTIKSKFSYYGIMELFECSELNSESFFDDWKNKTHNYPPPPPPKFKSKTPLKNAGWKTTVSFWVSAYFQGRAVKLREGIPEMVICQLHSPFISTNSALIAGVLCFVCLCHTRSNMTNHPMQQINGLLIWVNCMYVYKNIM